MKKISKKKYKGKKYLLDLKKWRRRFKIKLYEWENGKPRHKETLFQSTFKKSKKAALSWIRQNTENPKSADIFDNKGNVKGHYYSTGMSKD